MPDIKFTVTANTKDAEAGFQGTDTAVAKATAGTQKLAAALDAVSNKAGQVGGAVAANARRSARDLQAVADAANHTLGQIARANPGIRFHGPLSGNRIRNQLTTELSPSTFAGLARTATTQAVKRVQRREAVQQQAVLRAALTADPSAAGVMDAVARSVAYRSREGTRAQKNLRAIRAYATRMGLSRGDDIDFDIARRLFATSRRASRQQTAAVSRFSSYEEMQLAMSAGVNVRSPSAVRLWKWNRDINHMSIGAAPASASATASPAEPLVPREDRHILAGIRQREYDDQRLARIERDAAARADAIQARALADRAAREERALVRSNRLALHRRLTAQRNRALVSHGVTALGTAGAGLIAGSRFAGELADADSGWAQAASSFEREMRPVIGLEDNASRQAQLRRQVLGLAVSSGISTGQAAGEMNAFLQDASLFNKKQQQEILSAGVGLSRVSDSSAGENMKSLTRALQIWGDKLGNIPAFAGKLDKTVAIGSMSMDELARRLAEISAAMKAAGYSPDETLGVAAIGSQVTGSWDELATDLRKIATRMWKAEETGLVTPGLGLADQLQQIHAKRPTTRQLVQTFGEGAYTSILSLAEKSDQLRTMTRDIAATPHDAIARKTAFYESDVGTAVGLRSGRITAAAEAFKKGASSSIAVDRAQEGAIVQAADLGYEITMGPKSKAFIGMVGTGPLVKAIHRGKFAAAGMETTAQASFDQFATTGDRADADRAIADRAAAGAFMLADSTLTDRSWTKYNSKGRLVEGPVRLWGPKDQDWYRKSTQKDADAWMALKKQTGWTTMPFSVYQQYNDARETGRGNPIAIVAQARSRLDRPVVPTTQSATAWQDQLAAHDLRVKQLTEENAAGLARYAAKKPGQTDEQFEDELNKKYIDDTFANLARIRDEAKQAGNVLTADRAGDLLTSMRARKRELTRDDGRFSASDREILATEMGRPGRNNNGEESMSDRAAERFSEAVDRLLAGINRNFQPAKAPPDPGMPPPSAR